MAQAYQLQRPQLGVETTPGTAVAANRVLPDLELMPKPVIPETIVTAIGNLMPVDVIYGKEKTDFDFSSDATNPNTLLYLFNSLLKTGTITTPVGATLARLHTIDPASSAVNGYKTFTAEIGPVGSTTARKIDYVAVTDLDLEIMPEKAWTLKGKMIGRELSKGNTITASPTEVTQATISPLTTNVYIATTVAGLGAGQVKALKMALKFGKRFGDVYKIDSSESSYSTLIHSRPDFNATIDLDYDDAETLATFTKLRSRTQLYCRIVHIGDEIEAGQNFGVTLTFPFRFRDPSHGNQQDILAETMGMVVNHVSTFNTTGGAFLAEIVSDRTAL